ncbi:hypothetical protein VH22019_00104 [Vibrio phage VH2_2019]|nr:hypothetical protein VH22019_00104 [Vibrio phage VH2_2019]
MEKYAGRDGVKEYMGIKVAENGLRLGLRPILSINLQQPKGSKTPPRLAVILTYRLRVDMVKDADVRAAVKSLFLTDPFKYRKANYGSIVLALAGAYVDTPEELDSILSLISSNWIAQTIAADIGKLITRSGVPYVVADDLAEIGMEINLSWRHSLKKHRESLEAAVADYKDTLELEKAPLPDPKDTPPDTIGFGTMMENIGKLSKK